MRIFFKIFNFLPVIKMFLYNKIIIFPCKVFFKFIQFKNLFNMNRFFSFISMCRAIKYYIFTRKIRLRFFLIKKNITSWLSQTYYLVFSSSKRTLINRHKHLTCRNKVHFSKRYINKTVS